MGESTEPTNSLDDDIEMKTTTNVDPALFEPDPDGLDEGIAVNGIRKEFVNLTRANVVAVDSVTFKAFRGGVTTLLGHNGAGKTTTMNVLTGMFAPSAGEAFINGFSILTDMPKARESLGLCPQHNMLISDLTVREHLVFFGMVKTSFCR